MVRSLGHRGPDDSGTYVSDGAELVLGHTRLAILDLSQRAAQPMLSHDRRFVISYNGEIYNFRDLREELLRSGKEVCSSGDTEVLVEYIAAFGLKRAIDAIEGEWAFALWDTASREVTLARDRHGVKPLYYVAEACGRVRFASETKALMDGSQSADPTSVAACLLGLSVDWGTATMFREVRTVQPGEFVVFARGRAPVKSRFFRSVQWFDPRAVDELDRLDGRSIVNLFCDEIAQSTNSRLVSDAPLACLVSGGVDSCLVAAISAKSNPDLELYHADVEHDSERPAAELLAKHLGRRLRVASVTDRDLLDAIPSVTWSNDVPAIYHLNAIPFYLVSRLAHENGIKVLLTGEGSDEFFLGYPQYALRPVSDVVSQVRTILQDSLRKLSGKAGEFIWPRDGERPAILLRSLMFRYEEEILRGEAEIHLAHLRRRSDRLAAEMTLSLAQGHLLSLLHRNDRLGMAWSMESRFPFLGHRLLRLAANLPARYKLRWTARFHDWRHPFLVDKWVVRKAAEGMVPVSLARRRKQGFPVSLARRLRFSTRALARSWTGEFFGLDARALDALHAASPSTWRARVLLLDVWGQLFFLRRSIGEVQEWLSSNVKLDGTA
jgi:asparagine synthase (glutamine-hydrolysing)